MKSYLSDESMKTKSGNFSGGWVFLSNCIGFSYDINLYLTSYSNSFTRVPPVSSILRHASRIAKLLQLPCFPEPKLSTYTARFITDLHLPGEKQL